VSRVRALVLVALLALGSAAAGVAYHLWLTGGPGERLLAAQLPDVKGGSQAIEAWRGQVLVVNFWATWCAPCREEIPGFVRLQERYAGRGLKFVGIAFDQPDKVADFAREFAINYPLLIGTLDTMELMRAAGNRAGVLPYTVVLDRRGNLVSREPGGLKESRLEAIITPLI
jgi:thiol-disulfide isomerase/thioredoxin